MNLQKLLLRNVLQTLVSVSPTLSLVTLQCFKMKDTPDGKDKTSKMGGNESGCGRQGHGKEVLE